MKNDFLNVTDPALLKNLFCTPFTDKRLAQKSNLHISGKGSFKNSVQKLIKVRKEEMERRLNQTEVGDEPSNAEGREGKMCVIESITNLQFENQSECNRMEQMIQKRNPTCDKMMDDIKPMFYFNAKREEGDESENSRSEVETPCFVGQLSKKNSKDETGKQIRIDKSKDTRVAIASNILEFKPITDKLRRMNVVISNSPVGAVIVKMVNVTNKKQLSGSKKCKLYS